MGKAVAASKYDSRQRAATTVCPECVDQVVHVRESGARRPYFRHGTPHEKATRLCSKRVIEAHDHAYTRIMTAVMAGMSAPSRLSIMRLLAANLMLVFREIGALDHERDLFARVLQDGLLDLHVPRRSFWCRALLAAADRHDSITQRHSMLLRHLADGVDTFDDASPLAHLIAVGWASAMHDIVTRRRFHPQAYARFDSDLARLTQMLEGQQIRLDVAPDPTLGVMLGLKVGSPPIDGLLRALVVQRTVDVLAALDIDHLLADPADYLRDDIGWVYLMSRRPRVALRGVEHVVKIGMTGRSIGERREEIAAAYPDMDWTVLDGALVRDPAAVERALKAAFSVHRPVHFGKAEYFRVDDATAMRLFRHIVDGEAPAAPPAPEQATNSTPATDGPTQAPLGAMSRKERKSRRRQAARSIARSISASALLRLVEEANLHEAYGDAQPVLAPEITPDTLGALWTDLTGSLGPNPSPAEVMDCLMPAIRRLTWYTAAEHQQLLRLRATLGPPHQDVDGTGSRIEGVLSARRNRTIPLLLLPSTSDVEMIKNLLAETEEAVVLERALSGAADPAPPALHKRLKKLRAAVGTEKTATDDGYVYEVDED